MSRRYTLVAISLHWLIAIGILMLLAIGLTMGDDSLDLPTKFRLFQLHKSIGITVLLAVVLRVLWRLGHRPPPLPPGMPVLEQRAASGTHFLLYALMLGLPLTGWAAVSASPLNIPTFLYGVIPWPHLPILSTLANKKPVAEALEGIHSFGAWTLMGFLVLHVLAALRHHFWLRDDILTRMLPWRSRSRLSP